MPRFRLPGRPTIPGQFLLLLLVAARLTAVPPVVSSPGSAAGTEADDGPLTVGAVQWHVTDDVYASEEAFTAAADREIRALGPVDLVVFPEYTSVLLGLLYVEAPTAAEAARTSGRVRETMDRIWGRLARRYDVHILAGTWFDERNGRLYNRAVVYGPDGRAVYEQDKVWPGQPERDRLDLAAGRREDARPFLMNGRKLVLSICRDTYHESWEDHWRGSGADLWIDIKANELPYSEAYFAAALPARLADTDIPRGLTVSLTGSFGGYRFEGLTFLTGPEGTEGSTLDYRGSARLVVDIP